MKKISMVALLLVTVIVTSYSVSGTYAKYTSTYTGTDSARVAKWAFSINDTEMTTNEFTFDLFNTVKDTDNSTETDITDSTGTIIAPGTQGSFDIKLANNSEVNAKYSIDYSVEKTASIPVEFSNDGITWESDINELDVADTNINMNGAEDTKTIYWRWTFERTDEDAADTALGSLGTDTVTVKAIVTATQID